MFSCMSPFCYCASEWSADVTGDGWLEACLLSPDQKRNVAAFLFLTGLRVRQLNTRSFTENGPTCSANNMYLCVANALEDWYITVRSFCTKIVPRTFKRTTCTHTYVYICTHIHTHVYVRISLYMNAQVLRGKKHASQQGILLLFTSFSFCSPMSSEMFQTGTGMVTSTYRLEKNNFWLWGLKKDKIAV